MFLTECSYAHIDVLGTALNKSTHLLRIYKRFTKIEQGTVFIEIKTL